MKISASLNIRVIGGASVLALSTGIAAPVFAQSAPDPLDMAPIAPADPAQPADIVQCAESSPNQFVCAPGTDPDGVGEDPLAADPADPIFITIQEGAFVTGSTGFASGASVTGDIGTRVNNFGTIVGGANGAAILNSDSALNNFGFISSDSAIGIRTNANVVIRNAGTIVGDNSIGLVTGFAGTRIVNRGLMQNDGGSVLLVTGDGLASTTTEVINEVTGSIFGAGDDADVISINEGALIQNDGLIQAFGEDSAAIGVSGALELENTGNIVSNAGFAIELGGESNVENRGLIEGEVAIFTIAGSDAAQTVANFGTITGTIGEALVLGSGDDEYQHWTGAVTDGNVRLGADNDTFVLEGTASTINGLVAGGSGTDTAILGGVFDADILLQFEDIQLGTLFDLTITGARSVEGDVSFVGNTTFNLGVDSLTVDGNVTLEAGSTITILTPLDAALAGQTVTVIDETGTFTDAGSTITVVDDDLLLDYAIQTGSLQVVVSATNPLAATNLGDPNLDAIANAVTTSVGTGALSATTFDQLNSLGTADAYQQALVDALPSLSEAVGREIFETSTVASQSLERHLSGDSSGIWGQFVVRGVDQDAQSLTASGYDSDQLIFTVGGDFVATDDIRIGLLASYADIENTDLDAQGAVTDTSDVESIKLGAYIAVELFDRGFLNTEVAYLTGEVDTARSGFFGPITSSFDFDGIATRATLGYDILPDENVSITPTIGVNAAEINFDDATEAGGFGFAIERGDAEFIELRAGLELAALVSESVSGFVSGTVIHDVIDSERSFQLTSAELPTLFTVFPQREQDRFELNAGATIDVSDTFGIDIGYMGDFNSGYTAHAARANLKVAF